MSRTVNVEIVHREVSYATYSATVEADKFEEYHGFPIEEAEVFDIETWCEDEKIELRLASDELDESKPYAVYVNDTLVSD